MFIGQIFFEKDKRHRIQYVTASGNCTHHKPSKLE